ncbi:MAG: hypothetical protein GXO47_14485 [Chlorobi bacterium]|nr:hypothetical protein [Chlorobiota bacterium]
MDKDRLKEIVNNPDFIPGIYNFCDRWCERCTMTSRCATYAIDKERFPDEESMDMSNEKFWDKLSEMFKITIEMIMEDAEKRGIDLSGIDDTAIKEREDLRKSAEETELVKLSKKYSDEVEDWFKNNQDIFMDKENTLQQQIGLAVPGINAESDAADINDVVDVIRWYQYQIYVKLMRAVTGKLEGMQDEIDDMAQDYNGSAKVVLLGTDRSISAWGRMLQHFPREENNILDILVLLEKIRKQTEAFFPDARSFKRPGFDD